MINESLVRETMQYIEENPDQWDQDTFGADFNSLTGEYVRSAETGCKACFFGTMAALASAQGIRFGTERLSYEFGLSANEFKHIFYWVPDKTLSKDVQVKELKERVTKVTGIEF
jgi:hypothetical protein